MQIDKYAEIKDSQRYSTKRKRNCDNCVKLDRYGFKCREGGFMVLPGGCCDLHTLDLRWLEVNGQGLHGKLKK